MKTNLMRKIVVMLAFVMAITLVSTYTYAASVTIAAGSTNLTVGSSTTLTIRANNVTGRINITSSNPGVIALSSSSEWVENGAVTVRATAKAAGSAYITVSSADTSDSTTGNPVTVSAGVNLTSKAVVVDTRSKNNYLASLNVEGYELSPAFNTNTNNYTMNVGYDVSSLNVSGIPADNKSRTVVNGNLDLVAGENNVTVTVTAENGYKRVYTITVTKEKNPDDVDATISSLVIGNATLKNEFKPDVFEYMCDDITADVNKLNIEFMTKIPDLKYEVIGNEELKQGINHVVIKVTSRDGSVTKEYEIIVFKTDEVLALEETVPVIADADDTSGSISNIFNEYKYEIFLGVGIIVVIIIIVILVKIIKKNKKENEEVEEAEDDDTEEEQEEIEEKSKENIEEIKELDEEKDEKEIEETEEINENKEIVEDVKDEKPFEIIVDKKIVEEKYKVRKGNLDFKEENEDKEEAEVKIKLDLSSLNAEQTDIEE